MRITNIYSAVYEVSPAPLLHIHFNRSIIRRVWLHTCAARTLARPLPYTDNAARVAEIRPAPLFVQSAPGKYSRLDVQGPGVLQTVHDAPEYSRPRASTPTQTAVYIPKNHAGVPIGASVPAPEYSTSTAAKNAVQARQYGNVQSLAIRATISAVKLAIAPRARFVDVATVKESTISIDDIEYTAETLESADGDARGSYTTTLKNALASLQMYAHSDTAAYPENADAADLLSVATLAILDAARRVGIDAETWASGYNADGTPLTRIITNHKEAGKIVTGYRAVFATITAAVNAAIRGEKTRQDGKISIDAVSMGSDATAPAHFDTPDVYSMDAAAAWELSDSIRAAILASTPKAEKAARRVRIAGYLASGYKQAEIARFEECTQSAISKDISAIRAAIAPMLHV